MKKAFDQTVRDLRREVNKKVRKVHGIEQKVLDATSNEPWGPHGAHLADIAQATKNFHEYQLVMTVILKRINDTGKNWRHVYKGLAVLEYLVINGSERVIEEIREHAYQISTLSNFQYIDSNGRDQGSNVRKKSQVLVALVSDREKLQEIRKKAAVKRERSDAGTYKPGSYSQGGYAQPNPYVESRYLGHNRSRSEDGSYVRYHHGAGNHNRNGHDEYQSGSKNNEGDGKLTYDNDNEDEYHTPRTTPPSYEEAMGEAQGDSANSGESDATPQVSVSMAPKRTSPEHDNTRQGQTPSIDTLTSPHENEGEILHEIDPRGSVPASNTTGMDLLGLLLFDDSINSIAPAPEIATSSAEPGITNSVTDNLETTVSTPTTVQAAENPFEDPPFKAITDQESTAHCPSTGSTMPQSGSEIMPQSGSEMVDESNSGPAASPTSQALPGLTIDDSLFGLTYSPSMRNDNLISATQGISSAWQPAEEPIDDVLAGILPQSGSPTASSGQMVPFTGPPRSQTAPPNFLAQCASPFPYSSEVAAANPFALSTVLLQVTSSPDFSQMSALRSQGFTQNYMPSSVPLPSQAAPTNNFAQAGLQAPPQVVQATSATRLPPLKSTKPSEKFETKSAIWADTLSRGLINLDISGHSTNPLADIGLDFDAMNRKEKRLEKPAVAPVSTVTMGKAMGSGSGIGRTGATGIAPPQNPMLGSGMGMGMGVGMNPGNMGMGMGMGMEMGMGMPMGVGSMNPYGGGVNQQPMAIGMGMGMPNMVGNGMGMGVRPNMMGNGMGMGVGHDMVGNGMGMGIGHNMVGNGMGMRMPLPGGFQGGVGSGPAMSQGPAVSGSGYNPMTGIGGYGSQQQFGGGGYR